MKPKGVRKRDLGFYVLILIILLSVFYLMTRQDTTVVEVSYSQMQDLFKNEQVESFAIEDGYVNMALNAEYEGSMYATHELYSATIFYSDLGELINQQHKDGILTDYDYKVTWNPWWLQIIPYVLIFGVFIVAWFFIMNRSGGGAGNAAMFGKARTTTLSESKKKVTFNDVAGADEEKAELQEIVDFLKDPKKYIELGARMPKGVLLVGPPGTGKTLLAKAVAGEAGVKFLSISGSDFVELYVGVGASRVRDLFEQAKKAAPAIVFIDEIDAVGRQRGAGMGGGHDEREQTLNQLLVEMDGFETNDGVIVMAATNRVDILDSALMRPGRFDRQVYVGLPDIKGREEILKVHARNKSLGDDVDLAGVAKSTIGFTGADLENLLNEAAIMSASRKKRFITMQEMEDATLKLIAGPEKKSRVVSDKARKLTAYHEAGHAVTAYFLPGCDPVHHITIIPRGQAGGMTVYRPEEEKDFTARGDMLDRIVSALGGRIAEKLMLDDISTGASGDIQHATSIARSMVAKYGMSDELGPVLYDGSDTVFIGRDYGHTKGYSEKTAAAIDDEVRRIMKEASDKCEQILTENMGLLIATAEFLLENETMDGKTFKQLCDAVAGVEEPAELPEGEVTALEAPASQMTPAADDPDAVEDSIGDPDSIDRAPAADDPDAVEESGAESSDTL